MKVPLDSVRADGSPRRLRPPGSLVAAAVALVLASCGPAPVDDAGTDAGPSRCDNGLDDDGDGYVDFPAEPGCASRDDDDEADPLFPRGCANGQDDDEDGLVDYPQDPGCASAWDDQESDSADAAECSNGIDDDDDGQIDFPDDPGCVGPDDPDETDPQCADGLDNDGDGLVDWPADPHCASPVDNDESPPPDCGNGADDDGDMLVDFPLDPGCESPFDDDEQNLPPCNNAAMTPVLPFPSGGVATGALVGASGLMGSCGGSGPEVVYFVDPPGPLVELVADSTGTVPPVVVYARFQCGFPASEAGCGDAPAQAILTLTNLPAAPLHLVVDGRFNNSDGNYVLQLHGTLAPGAGCVPGDPVFGCPVGHTCEMTGLTWTCSPRECADGLDNDGDGLVDFGLEPGCSSLLDDDETDPVPLPECADGADNDGDGLVDFGSDPGCTSAGDDIELQLCIGDIVPTDLTVVGTGMGVTSGGGDFSGSCGGGSAGEVIFFVDPPGALNALTISTAGSTYDTLVYVRETACVVGLEQACADDGNGAAAELTIGPLGQERLWIFVDGAAGATGSVLVTVTGTLTASAPCTPGDVVFGCAAAAGFACEESTPGAADFACRPQLCANGLDDDGDGYADWSLDLGCTAPDDDTEGPDPACWNGGDDDGDGATDFPADPGCDAPSDPDETDGAPPACSNGIDDDTDGATDYPGDLACASAADPDEGDDCVEAALDVTAAVLAAAPGEAVLPGSTAGSGNDFGATCGGSLAPDVVYAVRLTTAWSELRARTVAPAGTSFDTVVSIRGPGCGAVDEVSCSDDEPACCFSDASVAPVWPGTWFVVVDGDGIASGDYELRIGLTP